MTEHAIRCFLLAHQGPKDEASQIEDHLAELAELFRPRAEVIADVVPPGARWWAALGPLPVIGVIWVLTAWHSDGFMRAREFLAGEDAIPDTRLD